MGGRLRPHLTVVSGVVEKTLRDDLDVIRAKHHIDSRSKLIAKVLEEYPNFVRTTNPEQRIQVDKPFNPLNCQVLKVSHHGSKHGTALECVEILDPEYAIVSCSDSSRHGFPHEIALLSIKEKTDRVFFTDYSTTEKPKSGTPLC